MYIHSIFFSTSESFPAFVTIEYQLKASLFIQLYHVRSQNILLNLGILPCIRHLSPLKSSSTLVSSWRLILQGSPSNSSRLFPPYLIQEALVLISSSSSSALTSSICSLAPTRSLPFSSSSSCFLLVPGTFFSSLSSRASR